MSVHQYHVNVESTMHRHTLSSCACQGVRFNATLAEETKSVNLQLIQLAATDYQHSTIA